MGKRTSITLDSEQEYAIKRLMVSKDCSKARAISLLIDGGLRERQTTKLLERVTLKAFFFTTFITHFLDNNAIENLELNYEKNEKIALMEMLESEE